jgi:hypothetical protein
LVSFAGAPHLRVCVTRPPAPFPKTRLPRFFSTALHSFRKKSIRAALKARRLVRPRPLKRPPPSPPQRTALLGLFYNTQKGGRAFFPYATLLPLHTPTPPLTACARKHARAQRRRISSQAWQLQLLCRASTASAAFGGTLCARAAAQRIRFRQPNADFLSPLFQHTFFSSALPLYSHPKGQLSRMSFSTRGQKPLAVPRPMSRE